MSDQTTTFQDRVGQIRKTHSRRDPHSYTVRADGLVVPRTRSRLRFYFPWRAIVTGFLIVVLAKASMIAALGQEGYVAQVNTLLEGAVYQEVAASILTPDPVTSWTAERITAAIAWVAES